MGFCVLGGAMLQCSFGMAPSTLNVLPAAKVMSSMALASIMDNVPMVNIMPFGMCSSMANPTVAAATAAALGTLTPMPCIPVIPGPWVPGSPTVLVGNKPALNNSCSLMCAYGGTIKIQNPGTTNIQVK
ncbi:DUF4280 domain-containing protein [Lachnoclostridium edouardi]|uniref:DUF4280 domain-containing protein n=1 Tax=Lachnoclostridium edouardi TaxID=1926283 RepID=UPI000C7C2E93|nr:DUF4280 domain-containing protein [Lachnoclostridium edouardi]MDO4278947.1 DUF4280 domain-containing protein [Lachnoclostridium edouardi]